MKREAHDVASTLPDSVSSDWRVYEGDDFTIRYPPGATLLAARSHPNDIPGTAIRGPIIHVPVPADVGPSDGPAYQLIVSNFPNTSHKTTEQWVDSLRREANNHEMDADSLGFLASPDTVAINRFDALRLEPFCGDCAPEELYIAGRNRTVVLSYVFDISFPGNREAQSRVYQAIMSTFSWKP
jgi:hypothetical protein